MRRSTHRISLICLLAAPWSLVAGCGGRGGEVAREPVSGAVTLDGRPVPSGAITFTPSAGGGSAVVRGIRDGKYQVDRDEGPLPGSYGVEVVIAQPTGKKFPHPAQRGQWLDEFSHRTYANLTADVRPGAENKFDFALSSRAGR
jgi:hypothetical protein